MSFNVNFYAFTKEVNSTAQPTGTGTVYACVSNANFDIISPRLPLNIGAAANPTGLNYCRVQAWSRYYWVTRWAFEGGLWVAYCSVDPLASWKTEIGATSAYVLRAAAASDGSLVDHMYPTKAGPAITKTTISSPWPSPSYDNGYYCVGVINKDGATEYYKMSPSTFTSFCAAAFSDTFFNSVKDQSWMTKAIFDPMQYLSSVTWFPAIPGAGFAQPVYLGYWNTQVSAPLMNDAQIGYYKVMSTISVSLPSHPQAASRGAYLNSAPYTNRILDLKPFGRIAIDANAVAGESSITLEIVLDYITGIGILRVLRGSDSAPLATQQAQVGLPVQVSQVLRDYFGGALNVASNAAGAVGSLLTGNIAGAIQGGLSAIGGAVETSMPDVTTSGHNGGFAALYGNWFLVSTFYQIADEDQTHRGRPLCQVRQLSTLSGYQLCTDTDLQIPCTKAEMDVIRGYLESGYYYE